MVRLANRLPFVPVMILTIASIGAVPAAACSTSNSGPRVDSALPRSANATGNTFVLIRGDHFARDAQARLGGSQLDRLTWVNARLLTGEVPGGMKPGAYNLTVANPSGGTTTLPAAITITGAKSAPPAAATAPPATVTRAPASSVSPATGTPERPPATASPSPTPEPVTASPSPSPSPRTAEPTQQPPATETPPPATQRPTQPPPRPTQPPPAPTQPPATQPPSPPPARATQPPAAPQNRTATQPNLAGQWTIVDSVTYGPGIGGTYPFAVTIQQSGTTISGSGGGIRFNGVIDGTLVHVNYAQDNGSSGSFEWATDAGGTVLSGSFTNSIGNGGDSYGQRSGSGTVVTFAAAPGQGQGDEHGNATKNKAKKNKD